ncbi:hypothetical protein AVT_27620 (plasmid) [Bacillus tropicus]|uniref:Phr family secreted Rap phosphatase inhibitor n=4 Tax=Bacillus cereus group TaxID=86661 RepID=A1BZT9_BACCE|nr:MULTISPECIES: hypothetical protein [Bacillus]MDL2419355.1 hypothetical protein [Bacillus shihchuchen]ABK00803.1 conserved hypothetical protein [Bacillus cereus]ABK01068.1 conserved hypothetical protein [Bacillus cereus]ACK92935.1 conserved domain protein [Bacillus cereus AH820]MCX3322852.1 hypothetical protein [Bacillus paranthracis]
MKKVVLSLMGIVTAITLTIGVTNTAKTPQSYEVIQGLSIGDHGG